MNKLPESRPLPLACGHEQEGDSSLVRRQQQNIPGRAKSPGRPPGTIPTTTNTGPHITATAPQRRTSSQPSTSQTGPGRVAGLSPQNVAGTTVVRKQPQLNGDTLIYFFPPSATITCPHVDCSAKFRAEVWTSAKQSLGRHLLSMHLVPTTTVVKCTGCDTQLGVRPGSHKCIVAITIAGDAADRFACTMNNCTRTYQSI
ncbi:hypothetical protein AGLY_012206 [Aphis glycines]|uniref:Uncharacterized protein n=1 Tax=Aphis glycines TaxID=307491 RepID=A0A6G0TAR7_APHGL|nr:hypothetical protein AGLY_012206 [Aphis glycines]